MKRWFGFLISDQNNLTLTFMDYIYLVTGGGIYGEVEK